MNIALTGASGHIGVNLCRLLAKKNHNLKVLIHKNTQGLESLPLEITHGDLMVPDTLQALVKDADIVIHLAAVISIRGTKDKEILAQNVEGTANILAASQKAKVKRFIHFSSIHALNHEPYDQILEETRPLALNDWMIYSRSKALAEKEVIAAGKDGLNTVILNPTAVIGPYDYAPSLLGRALILLAQNKLPILVPGGYNWVDVRDVAQATENAIQKARSEERYLLSGHWSDLKEFAKIISTNNSKKPPRFTSPYWLARVGIPFLNLYCSICRKDPLYTRDSLNTLRCSHPRISNSKAVEELDFNPRPLEVTLQDTLNWFQKEGYYSC